MPSKQNARTNPSKHLSSSSSNQQVVRTRSTAYERDDVSLVITEKYYRSPASKLSTHAVFGAFRRLRKERDTDHSLGMANGFFALALLNLSAFPAASPGLGC